MRVMAQANGTGLRECDGDALRVNHPTDNPEVIKAWDCPDAELQSMRSILPRLPLSVRDSYRECIRLHAEYIESGLVGIPWRYQEILQSLDPYLRLRWDMQCQCYVVERIDTGLRAWIRIFRWAHPDGTPKPMSEASCRSIVLKLRESDMQRYDSPQEYLQEKRDKAERQRRYLWNRGNDILKEAIDRLPRRSVEEFVAAERAIASGERIKVTGQDAATLNRWYEMQKVNPVELLSTKEAINPGQAPVR